MATPTVPTRHGRPKLSLITTPGSQPVSARSRSRKRSGAGIRIFGQQQGELAAGRVGDIGLIDTRVRHDQVPAGARRSGHLWRRARSRRDSRRTSSTSRGSFCTVCASSSAPALGATLARSMRRPSALEITFCANTKHIVAAQLQAARASAAAVRPARSSPHATCGKSGNAMSRSSAAAHRMPPLQSSARVQPNAARSLGKT